MSVYSKFQDLFYLPRALALQSQKMGFEASPSSLMCLCLLSSVLRSWGLSDDKRLPRTSRVMRDDIGTGKKIAVGMLVMLVFFSVMSNDWLVIPANAPMAMLSIVAPLTPSFLSLGE